MWQVVDRNTPWDGGLVAINSFGFGGANAHAIFESEPGGGPARPPARYAVPRVVLASGRTEQAVRELTELAAAHHDDAGLHALLDAVHRRNIPGHSHRGFVVLSDPPMHECIVSMRRVGAGCRLLTCSRLVVSDGSLCTGNGERRSPTRVVRVLGHGLAMARHGQDPDAVAGVRS